MADQGLHEAGWSEQVQCLCDLATVADSDLPKYLMVHKDFHDDWCGLHLLQGDLLEVFGFHSVSCVCGEYEAGDGTRQVLIPTTYEGKVRKMNRSEYQFPLVKDLVRHFPKYVRVTHNAKPQERLLGLNEIVELVKADEHFLYVKKNGSDFQLPLTYKGDFEEVMFPDNKEYTLEEIINRCMFPIWVKMTEMKSIREGFTLFTHFSGEVKLSYVMEEKLLLCRVVKDDELQDREELQVREDQHTNVMCIPVDFICRQSCPLFKVPTGILRHSRRHFSAKPDWDLRGLNTAVSVLNFVTTHKASLHPRKPSVTDQMDMMPQAAGTSQKPVPPPRRIKKPVERATVSGGEALPSELTQDQNSDDHLKRKKPNSLSDLDRLSANGMFENNFDHVETRRKSDQDDDSASKRSSDEAAERAEDVFDKPAVLVMQQSSIPEDPPPPPPVIDVPEAGSPVKPTPPPVSPKPRVSPVKPGPPRCVTQKQRPPDLPPRPVSPHPKSATLPNARSQCQSPSLGSSRSKHLTPPARPPNSPRQPANRQPLRDPSDLQQLVPLQEAEKGGPQGYVDMNRGSESKTEPPPPVVYLNDTRNTTKHPKPPPLEPVSDNPNKALCVPNRKLDLSAEVTVEDSAQSSYVIMNSGDSSHNHATMGSGDGSYSYATMGSGDSYLTVTTPTLVRPPHRVPPPLPPRPKGSLSSSPRPNSPHLKDLSSASRDRGSGSSSSRGTTDSEPSDGSINSVAGLSHIPSDLHLLGVNGLADALHHLKLDQLADTCRDNLIDGTLFLKLTEQELKEEPFSLSTFHLTKALLFKDSGWVPNMN